MRFIVITSQTGMYTCSHTFPTNHLGKIPAENSNIMSYNFVKSEWMGVGMHSSTHEVLHTDNH